MFDCFLFHCCCCPALRSQLLPYRRADHHSLSAFTCSCRVNLACTTVTHDKSQRFLFPLSYAQTSCKVGGGGNQWLTNGNVLTASDCSSYCNLSAFWGLFYQFANKMNRLVDIKISIKLKCFNIENICGVFNMAKKYLKMPRNTMLNCEYINHLSCVMQNVSLCISNVNMTQSYGDRLEDYTEIFLNCSLLPYVYSRKFQSHI